MKKKSYKVYKTVLEVKPLNKFARFPMDMLRYDNCVPYSEKDAYIIEKYGILRSKERDDHAEYFANFEAWKNRQINEAIAQNKPQKFIDDLINKIDAGTYDKIPSAIRLGMLRMDANTQPNVDRWQSFGWDVKVIPEL